jgi:hypothetical protein
MNVIEARTRLQFAAKQLADEPTDEAVAEVLVAAWAFPLWQVKHVQALYDQILKRRRQWREEHPA